MGRITKLEDVLTWQKAGKLALNVYKIFRDCKDFGFKSQIQRAGISVMNNIAEGFERGGKKEFKRFLRIARGSCGEVRSMSYLALKLGYLTNQEFRLIYSSSSEITKMINGIMRKL